jgi:hypothetical protein
VVQTAQNFVRGFLGQTATAFGTVITVNSTGSPQALFDSLSPSDQCPLFVDGNGGIERQLIPIFVVSFADLDRGIMEQYLSPAHPSAN